MDLHVMSMMMEATAGWVKLLLVALQTRFWPRFDLWRSLTTRSLTTILGRVVLWGKYQVSSICRLPPSLFKTRKGSLFTTFLRGGYAWWEIDLRVGILWFSFLIIGDILWAKSQIQDYLCSFEATHQVRLAGGFPVSETHLRTAESPSR